jgi:hypothetical protein
MNDTLERIRAIDPCAGREPDMDRLDAALERIVALPREPRRRARRRPAIALAAAVALAALVVAIPGGHRLAPAGAATVLRDARAAALQLDGPGPWTVVETRDWRNEPPGGAVPYLTEAWSSDDGQQLTRVTRGAPGGPPDPYDGKLIRRDTAGFGPTVAEIRGYPTDPAALADKLGRDAVQGATMLLLSPAPTAELRAALYNVLLDAPGATLIPSLTAPDGSKGVGVRFATPTPPHELTLLFDPGTHALLGVGQGDTWDLVLRVERVAAAPRPDLVERMKDGRPEFVPVR